MVMRSGLMMLISPTTSGDPACIFTLKGTASGTLALFLVDSGATHCFADSSFAAENGYARYPKQKIVQLADGTCTSANQKCNI